MKKIVGTLILSLLSAMCLFSFTACGGNENETENEVKTTVIEEEWKASITLITEGNENFACNGYETNGKDRSEVNFKYGSEKKVTYGTMSFKEESSYFYYWTEGSGKNYFVSGDSDNQSKQSIEDEDFQNATMMTRKYYAGGVYLELINDKFSEFTYSEENKEYTGNIEVEGEGAAFVLKFEEGKIINLKINETEGDVEVGYSYTYGTSVTVPDSVKNLPLDE